MPFSCHVTKLEHRRLVPLPVLVWKGFRQEAFLIICPVRVDYGRCLVLVLPGSRKIPIIIGILRLPEYCLLITQPAWTALDHGDVSTPTVHFKTIDAYLGKNRYASIYHIKSVITLCINFSKLGVCYPIL